MRVGLIASPFDTISSDTYGNAELFISSLALNLSSMGVEVTLYTNGASSADVRKRCLFPNAEKPTANPMYHGLREVQHTAWAMEDAARSCDVVHLNGPAGVSMARFVNQPVVCTIHHLLDNGVLEHYRRSPGITFVTTSAEQQRLLAPLDVSVIYYGLDLTPYHVGATKDCYFCCLGRVTPSEGFQDTLECAHSAGLALRLVGRLDPESKAYFDEKIRPFIAGGFVSYADELPLADRSSLFGKASALIYPSMDDELFGLGILEAMACGTPVIALRCGVANELVEEGVSGFLCDSLIEMKSKLTSARALNPFEIRQYVEQRFSAARMARDYFRLYESLLIKQS